MSNEPFGNGDEAPPSFFPQSYPLWAVRAANDEDDGEVGLVVGWKSAKMMDSWLTTPLVASLGQTYERGISLEATREWANRIDKEFQLIDRVEIYATFDEAQARAGALFREVGDEALRRWTPEGGDHV